MQWGLPELGLEDAAYNFFMRGVKSYTCGRCALTFGAYAAIHYCPHCNKQAEYDPASFHDKVTCGSCARSYGFVQFPCTDKREREGAEHLLNL